MPQVVAVAAAWVAKTITVKAVTAFVVKTVLQVAATVALSKAAKALGLSKQSIQERQASVTQLSLGEVPREAIFGLACTGGSLLDAFNFGGKYGTDTVTRVIELADHFLDGIVGYYVDDVYCAWTGDGVQPGFNGKLSIEFRNGFASGNVPPLHVRQNGGWSASDVLAGVAHVVVDTRFDDTVWTQGHPRFKFVVRGLRVYDPRRDPALGYTGPDPQTWGDTSTHTFSRNAALLRYAYTRGIYATGHQGEPEHLLIGRGLSAEEAPPARIIAAANLCDEAVDGEIRYTADGVISANQAYIEVEELFAAAMAGVIVQREGGVEIEPGQAKAPVVTITDGDLVIGKPIGATPFLPDSDGGRINTIVPRYVEPTQGWLDHAAPVIRDLSRMAPAPVGDGGPREMTLALALVIRASQANGNGAIALRKAALERRATITLPPRFAGLEEGDWIAWKSDRRHGGATVRYRIVSFSLNAEWQNSLVLEEIASSVYGVPDPVEDRTLPPPAPTPIDALQLFGVQAEAITLAGNTSTVPAVRFSWNVTTADTAMTAIRAEIRQVGETEAAPTRIDDVAEGQANVTNGVGPDQALECRLVPIGDPSRPVLASNWITVSTSTIVAGDVSPDAPGLSPIKEAIGAAGEGMEQIGHAVDGLNQTVYDAQTGLQVRTGQLWDDINDAADGLKVRTAGLDAAINAAGTGLADRTDALFDRLDAPGTGIEARVTDLAQTVEDGDEASLERFQALEAFAAAGPNHCPNGGLAEGLEGIYSAHTLVWGVSGTWGPNVAIAPSGDGTYSIHWPEFGVEEGVAYTVSGDAVLFASGGVVYFDIIYLNSAGQPVFDGGESPRGPGDFSDSFERRKSMAGTSVCPRGSGAVTARARCVFESVVNPTAMGVRRVKVDFGDKPTAWSDETTEWQGASRLIDLDEVVQNPTSGLVRRTELLDSQLNTPTVGLSAQIASARQAITDLDEGKAEASDVQALNTQINTPGTGLAAQQLSAQEAISDLAEGKASASDLNALTSEIETARGGQTSLNLRLNTVETDIDGKASATALQTLESEVNAPGTGIVARLTDAEGTVADLVTGKAEASDLEALEVRSRALPNLVPNSAAAQDLYLWDGDPIWKVGYGADVGSYFFCDAAGDQYMVSRPIRLGHNKTYSFEFEGDGGTAPTENAVYFDLMDGTDATPGNIVQYGAGALSYQGVWWFTRAGRAFTTGPSVKWGVAVVKKAAASNYVTMTRLMLNEGPVAAAWTDTLVARDLSARQLEMERVVLTPTTGLAERVSGLSSDLYTPTTGIAARLGSAQQTLVDLEENKASAADVEALGSAINTPGTGLLAEMAAVKETLVDLDEGKASASDVQDIQSALFTPTTGISARLTQVLQTAADLEEEKADVTALQQLEAITGVRENLALNGGLTDGLEGLGGGSGMALDEDSWGRSVKLATFTGTGTRVIDWPAVDSDPDTIYTISGDAVLFASGGVVYFDLQFLNEAGQVVGDGGQKPRGPGDFSNAPSRRQDMAVAHLSPSTAARMVPRCVFQDVVNPTAMGARLVKVERGGLPATTWSDEASAAYTAAKLADLDRVVTTPTTGLASRLETTEADINTPGTGLKAGQQSLIQALADLDAGKASVISVEDLTAQLRTTPNQIVNSGAKSDMDHWNGAAAWGIGRSGDVGDYFVCSASGEHHLVSQPFRLSPNTTYTHSFEGDGGSDPGSCWAYLALLGGTETTPGAIITQGAGVSSFDGVGWFTRKSVTFTTGPNVFWGQYVVRKAATSSYVATTRFMLNVGDKAAAWTDSLSERELRASIQEVRSVAVSADGRSKAIVGNVLDVNGYISGTASTNDGVQARFEVLADVFGIRSPGGGERTEYRAGRWYIYSPAEATRTVYGKALGGDQKIIWWTGPDTVAEGAETKANAYVYISQNTVGGPRFGGTDVVSGGGGDSALRSTIGGSAGASTQGTTWVSAGTASFTNLPAGGSVRIFAGGNAQDGMTVEGSAPGSTVNGEVRVVRGATVLATGLLTAYVAGGDADASIVVSDAPINAGATGAVTLTLQIRSTTANKDIGGAGMTTQVYAEWVKSG
ncbi:phage tail protein [Brevundimonas mediterranea]|uniref:Tip attachment protein J domain-containing protein n=1 Tax=Brevundimonas mediterranea TaxID=74329 RepID=A0A7Z8Y694_9CAUL|nr:phage tail protein [Brevundimonas mediterranea]VDC51445.1 hypothetical protein BREV_BREV_00514 [Brevundimonas mediterranea]